LPAFSLTNKAMSKAGEKRSLDGGNGDKLPFTDEQLAALEEPNKAIQRLEIAADRYRHNLLTAGFEDRDKIIDTMPGFWRIALRNSAALLRLAAIDDDSKALLFLKKVKAWRNPEQIQTFGFEFHFDANPFFSNSVLKKEFKYSPPSDPEVLKKDANGVSQADIDFDFSRDVDVIPAKIDWKDEAKNLTKLYPRIVNPEDPDEVEDPGSFFHLFESEEITQELYETEILAVYENAIDFFYNRGDGSLGDAMIDSDEEDEEDDDSDAEDIDLENPKKKAKK